MKVWARASRSSAVRTPACGNCVAGGSAPKPSAENQIKTNVAIPSRKLSVKFLKTMYFIVHGFGPVTNHDGVKRDTTA